MAEWCAVVGVGQTKHGAKRGDVSIAGLVREAAVRALEDAELTWGDIDAVVIGKAPDMFEGVMMPELYLADALGATGKPMMRVHTAGSVGGSTAVV
ncbi:MAG TPA: thiolase domain-containing protein, partial [Dehalococcoidia bacterium]|nr:thiolase domain-containing protein [Dehalococcoidia bacterium]